MDAQFNSSGNIKFTAENFKVGDGEIVLLGLHELDVIMKNFGKKLGKKLMKRVLSVAGKQLEEILEMNTPVSDKDVFRGASHVNRGDKAAQTYPSGTLLRSIGQRAARNRGSDIPAVWVGYRKGRRYPNNRNAWFRHYIEYGTEDRYQKFVTRKGKKILFAEPKFLGRVKPHNMMERSWNEAKAYVQADIIEGLNHLIGLQWKGVEK